MRRPNLQRSRECHGDLSMRKIMLKSQQILCLVPEVELLEHHRSENVDFLRQRQPLHAWEYRYEMGKGRHDGEVAGYCFGYTRVENLDSY